MLITAGAVVAAAIVAGVLVAVLSGGSSNSLKNVPAVGSISGGLPEAAAVEAAFKGIPQVGTRLGSPAAPVTLIEYIDLQCPFCQQFETQVMPDILRKYVRTGTLKIEMRPWAFIGPDSIRGQAAVLAAAQQNRAFNYAQLLYDEQGTENTGWLDASMVATVASSIPGLQVHALVDALATQPVKTSQQRVDDQAKVDKIASTPTLFAGPTGGRTSLVALKSDTDEATLVAAIKAAAAK